MKTGTRPASPTSSFTRSLRSRSPRRGCSISTSAPTSPIGSPRPAPPQSALKAHEPAEPVFSSWLHLEPTLITTSSAPDKELVQRHSEKCKQLREAHAARGELELQIAQLHAFGPQGVLRQRVIAAEAALAQERQQWSLCWQEVRRLLQGGQLEALRRVLDLPLHGSTSDLPQQSASVLTAVPSPAGALESRVRDACPPQPTRCAAANCIASPDCAGRDRHAG